MDNRLPQDSAKTIDAIWLTVQEIKQGLYGVPNTDDRGLCGDVREQGKIIAKNSNHIRRLWIAVAILASSIGGGIYGAIEVFAR